MIQLEVSSKIFTSFNKYKGVKPEILQLAQISSKIDIQARRKPVWPKSSLYRCLMGVASIYADRTKMASINPSAIYFADALLSTLTNKQGIAFFDDGIKLLDIRSVLVNPDFESWIYKVRISKEAEETISNLVSNIRISEERLIIDTILVLATLHSYLTESILITERNVTKALQLLESLYSIDLNILKALTAYRRILLELIPKIPSYKCEPELSRILREIRGELSVPSGDIRESFRQDGGRYSIYYGFETLLYLVLNKPIVNVLDFEIYSNLLLKLLRLDVKNLRDFQLYIQKVKVSQEYMELILKLKKELISYLLHKFNRRNLLFEHSTTASRIINLLLFLSTTKLYKNREQEITMDYFTQSFTVFEEMVEAFESTQTG